jgi:RHS repeat-associated protein
VELKVLGRHQAIALEVDSKAYAVINDCFGNITQLIDPCTGTVAANYRYSAFSEEERGSDPLTPWRYHQKREDPLTQLIYFGYRDYDCEIGGWTTPDPLGFADGPNLYAYVHHNPIAFHDPDGTTAYPHNERHSPQRNWGSQYWNSTKQFCSSFSRGFIDDTSWGTSDYMLGEHTSTNWTQRIGYNAGMIASLGAGLAYGNTEAKIAAYGLKGLKATGKQLYKQSSKLCTRSFKPVTVMSGTSTITKSTKNAEKYFVKKGKTSLIGKKQCAGWDDEYMAYLLGLAAIKSF